MSLNPTLAKSAIVAALGGLLFGFDTAVISGTTGTLTNTYLLSPTMLGVLARLSTSLAIFGELASCSASVEIPEASAGFSELPAILGGFAAFDLRLRLRRFIAIRF